jgi:hypothetical protein
MSTTTPVLTLDGRSIGDSTRIIAVIEQRWPQPSLYPDNDAHRQRALELEEFFDEQLGPHFRRAFYDALLPHPELLLPLFTHGQPTEQRAGLQAGFPALREAMRRAMQIDRAAPTSLPPHCSTAWRDHLSSRIPCPPTTSCRARGGSFSTLWPSGPAADGSPTSTTVTVVNRPSCAAAPCRSRQHVFPDARRALNS